MNPPPRHAQNGIKKGLALLTPTLVIAALLPPAIRLELVAGLLFVTAGVYLGFAWKDGRRPWEQIEGVAALPIIAAAWAGLHIPWLLAAGFAAHIAWDVAHHPRGIHTEIARWVPPACIIFDGAMALAILYWWPPWA